MTEKTHIIIKKIEIRKDSSLSKIGKYKKLQKLKENRPCVNCNQKGGTLFVMDEAVSDGFEGRHALIARCNAKIINVI